MSSIEDLKKDIRKNVGADVLLDNSSKDIPKISTGSIKLDALLEGGFPVGRVAEIYGPESSGKTTLTIHCIAEYQKANPEKHCVFVDTEFAFNLEYAEALGVDLDRIILTQPDSGEAAVEIVRKAAKTEAVGLIVLDSVAAMVPTAEYQGDSGQSFMGLQARLMSQMMRQVIGILKKNETTLLLINQLRENIGGYGNPEVTTGGKAIKFYASVRIDIRGKLPIKDGTKEIGRSTRVKVVKTKISSSRSAEAEFLLYYGKGISREGELLDLAVDANIIDKAGSWYSYGGDKLGQGKDAVVRVFEDNPELMQEVLNKLGL